MSAEAAAAWVGSEDPLRANPAGHSRQLDKTPSVTGRTACLRPGSVRTSNHTEPGAFSNGIEAYVNVRRSVFLLVVVAGIGEPGGAQAAVTAPPGGSHRVS